MFLTKITIFIKRIETDINKNERQSQQMKLFPVIVSILKYDIFVSMIFIRSEKQKN